MPALAALVVGILFLNQWRAGLIDARVQALRIQGEIISAAVAASATADSDTITVDPDLLLQMHTGRTARRPSASSIQPSNFRSVRNGWRRF